MAEKSRVDRNRDGHFNKSMDSVERFVPERAPVGEDGQPNRRTTSDMSEDDLSSD